MAMSFPHLSMPFSASSVANFSAPRYPVVVENIYPVDGSRIVPSGGAANFCRRFCGLKLRILKSLNLKHTRECRPAKEFMTIINQDKDHSANHLETTNQVSEEVPKINVLSDSIDRTTPKEGPLPDVDPYGSMSAADYVESAPSLTQACSLKFPVEGGNATSLCIAVIGATGELARGKNFPALFALYYSGFLPEDVAIFGIQGKV